MNNIRLSLPVRLVRFVGEEIPYEESYTNRQVAVLTVCGCTDCVCGCSCLTVCGCLTVWLY